MKTLFVYFMVKLLLQFPGLFSDGTRFYPSDVAIVESSTPTVLNIKIVTFNVLVEIEEKNGISSWDDRKQLCAKILEKSDADFIGLQEPTPWQVSYLNKQLPVYDVLYFKKNIVHFTDVVLMYRSDKYDLIEHGWWWLSPEPQRPSLGFGNDFPRILIWGKFRHIDSGREIFVMNTHFDNTMPSQSRMAELNTKMLKKLTNTGLPIVLMGDFNTDPTRGRYDLLVSNGWNDAYLSSEKSSETGLDNNVPTAFGRTRIDHILYFGDTIIANGWKRIESTDPQKKLSDHWPVFTELIIH